MNLKNLTPLLMGGLMMAALGFGSTGCNENTVDPNDSTGNGTAPSAPTGLMAVTQGPTQVGLKWTPSTDTGSISYSIEAIPTGAVVAGDTVRVTAAVGASTVTVTGLGSNKAYTFHVYSVRSTVKSTSSAQITWAGASRHSTSGTTMRMYEFDSQLGSGLTVDPAKGGPANISVRNASTDVQLAMYNLDNLGANDTILIGAAYAIEAYRNVNAFDINTYVSSQIFAVPSLDQWYENADLTTRFDNTGNLYYYKVLETVGGSNTYMFYLRTGTAGSYHYARVLLKKDGSGRILQGTAPNRYVEVEISYQLTPDLPYAKLPAGAIVPQPVMNATRGL